MTSDNRPLRTAVVLLLCVCAWAMAIEAQIGTITISVDAGANRHPINANVYGVAHASVADLNDLNVPLNRSGGNNTTRYNWQLNADNRGNDWYYESIADSSATAGERGDTFIANARAANAQAMLTIPLVGWVATVPANRSKLADAVSALAALRMSDGALTVMAINKSSSAGTTANITLANFANQGAAQAWQLTATNAITRLSDLTIAGTTLTATLPAQSITLFVIPGNGPRAPTNLRITR